MRARQVGCVALALLLGCSNVKVRAPKKLGETVRYRLLLRENPVSPRDAMHCFASCQSAPTPKEYVDCLAQCPGFESTPDEHCTASEVPPVAACLTVRKVPATKETPPGMVVLAIVAGMALMVGAASLCSASTSHCAVYGLPPPH